MRTRPRIGVGQILRAFLDLFDHAAVCDDAARMARLEETTQCLPRSFCRDPNRGRRSGVRCEPVTVDAAGEIRLRRLVIAAFLEARTTRGMPKAQRPALVERKGHVGRRRRRRSVRDEHASGTETLAGVSWPVGKRPARTRSRRSGADHFALRCRKLSRPGGSGLQDRRTPCHPDRRAGNITGFVGGEQHIRRRQFGRLARTFHRHLAAEVLDLVLGHR